jgi:hypothetical protein
MTNDFDAYMVAREHSVRNRPQQNGVAERVNRTLGRLSKAFWVECLSALVHVLDCCPTSAIEGATPYEVWLGQKPDVGHLRVWGCLADKRSKLDSHMEKCIFTVGNKTVRMLVTLAKILASSWNTYASWSQVDN